jgi:enamine deaminase RidA (YjgF/YER057c/UK114 family)
MIIRLHSNSRLSRVVIHGGIAYLSGLTADTLDGDVAAQTAQVLAKADVFLTEAGASRTTLLTAMIWLKDISDFNAMNGVWEKWIDPAAPPARATVEANLALPGIRVEIQLTAAVEPA